MDETLKLFSENKLLVRTLNRPEIMEHNDIKYYNVDNWLEEFYYLENDELNSKSTTLLVKDVGVNVYKGLGYLINLNRAHCFYVCLEDCNSFGSFEDDTFEANRPADFFFTSELADYIKEEKHTEMNEVVMSTGLYSVVGLFVVDCPIKENLLMNAYIVNESLKKEYGIEYPIYLYSKDQGKLSKIEMTEDLENKIISNLDTPYIVFEADDNNNPIFEDIKNLNKGKTLKKINN